MRGVDPETQPHILHTVCTKGCALDCCIALHMFTAPFAQAEQDCTWYFAEHVAGMGPPSGHFGIASLSAPMQVALCWMMYTLPCAHCKVCTISNCTSNVVAGTPVQNNMRELFGLMNLLDDEKYGDEEEFFEKFGGDKEAISLEQVQALQVDQSFMFPFI